VQINNTTVVDRGNRPNVSQRIGLRTFFINDGAYVDPYQISGVNLYARSETLTPKTVLGDNGLPDTTPLMAFSNGTGTLTNNALFDPTNYTPAVDASGIYRLGVGDYVVVLDQTLDLSGWSYDT
jgi:hypothetical protein